MKNLATRFKSNFNSARDNERGDVIQTVLTIAVFVAIVVVVGSLIYNAVQTKTTEVGKCITNAGKVSGNGTAATIKC